MSDLMNQRIEGKPQFDKGLNAIDKEAFQNNKKGRSIDPNDIKENLNKGSMGNFKNLESTNPSKEKFSKTKPFDAKNKNIAATTTKNVAKPKAQGLTERSSNVVKSGIDHTVGDFSEGSIEHNVAEGVMLQATGELTQAEKGQIKTDVHMGQPKAKAKAQHGKAKMPKGELYTKLPKINEEIHQVVSEIPAEIFKACASKQCKESCETECKESCEETCAGECREGSGEKFRMPEGELFDSLKKINCEILKTVDCIQCEDFSSGCGESCESNEQKDFKNFADNNLAKGEDTTLAPNMLGMDSHGRTVMPGHGFAQGERTEQGDHFEEGACLNSADREARFEGSNIALNNSGMKNQTKEICSSCVDQGCSDCPTTGNNTGASSEFMKKEDFNQFDPYTELTRQDEGICNRKHCFGKQEEGKVDWLFKIGSIVGKDSWFCSSGKCELKQ